MTAATTPSEQARLGYVPALDGLRGIAILLVLFWHAGVAPRGSGHAGVTLFFVLSGYLITRLLIEERGANGGIDLLAFYRRRILRLFPALVAVGLAVSAWYAISGSAHLIAADVGGAWLYVTNFMIIAGHDQGVMSHAWTLSIEEHFYLLWPAFLILVLARWPIACIVGLLIYIGVVAVVHVLFWSPDTHHLLHKGTPLRLDALLLGCLLALRPQRFGILTLAVAIGGIGLVAVSRDEPGMIRFALTAAALSSVVLVSWAASRPATPLAWGPLVGMGKVSYGAYLWHAPLFAPGRAAAHRPGTAVSCEGGPARSARDHRGRRLVPLDRAALPAPEARLAASPPAPLERAEPVMTCRERVGSSYEGSTTRAGVACTARICSGPRGRQPLAIRGRDGHAAAERRPAATLTNGRLLAALAQRTRGGSLQQLHVSPLRPNLLHTKPDDLAHEVGRDRLVGWEANGAFAMHVRLQCIAQLRSHLVRPQKQAVVVLERLVGH
jgi:peptidoglycan/LPS O-acetylase OafA/YrhL